MSKHIKFVQVVNPFNRADRDTKELDTELTLKEFIAQNTPDLGDETKFAWSINGHLVTDDTELKDGDCLVCVPSVEGGGDSKNPLAIIAGLVLGIVAFAVGGWVAGSMFLKGTLAYNATLGLVAGGLMQIGGQMLSNMFYNDSSDLVADTQSTTKYQWGSQSNSIAQGGPLAHTYGTVRIAGNLISQHVRNVPQSDGSSDSYLDLLYCGGEGPVDYIGDVEINGTAVSSFSDVSVQYRYGTNDQSVLDNFNEIIVDAFPSMTLEKQTAGAYDTAIGAEIATGASYTYTVGPCGVFWVYVYFPNNIRGAEYTESNRDHDRTAYYDSWVQVRCEYRVSGGSWATLFDAQIKTRDLKYDKNYKTYPYCLGGVSGDCVSTYEIRITKVAVESGATTTTTQFGRLNIGPVPSSWAQYATAGDGGSILEASLNFPSGLYHVNDEGSPETSSVRVMIQYKAESASGWSTFGNVVITENQTQSFTKVWRMNLGAAARYLVRMGVINQDGTTTRFVNTCVFSQLSHITPETLTRPGKVLVGISIKATDQLSGSMPTITWAQRRSYVWVYDSINSAWAQKPAGNPAWICYDMAVHAEQMDGNMVIFGEQPSRMDYAAFAGWAAWNAQWLNNRPPLILNLFTDEIKELWSWFSAIGASGRGAIVLKGTKISCIWDEPSDPVQLFTVGNIITDSLSGEYLGSGDRANAIEVSFLDANKKYDRRQITVYADSYNETDQVTNTTSVYLYGVTNYDLAYSEGWYRMLQNKYLFRTISIQASVDAIACQVGDVVSVQHDVPQWGYGGRTLPGSTDTVIKLDREVSMTAGTSYAFVVTTTDADGKIERFNRDVVNNYTETTTTDTITLSTALPAVPMDYSNYSFGISGKVTKPFRVKSIERTADLECTLSLTEYIAAVYTESTNIPTIEYTTDNVAITGVTLTEGGYVDPITLARSIVLTASWKWGETRPLKCQTQYSINGGKWINGTMVAGTVNMWNVPNVRTGDVIRVRVRPYDDLGIAHAWVESSSYTVLGSVFISPADVQNFRAVQDGDYIDLSWTANTEANFDHYELREGYAWNTGTVIEAKYTSTSLSIPVKIAGIYGYMIKAVNNYGAYSDNAATVQLTVKDVSPKNVILTFNELKLYCDEVSSAIYCDDSTISSAYCDENNTVGTLDNTQFIDSPYYCNSMSGYCDDSANSAIYCDEYGNDHVLTLTDGSTSGSWTSDIKDMGKVLISADISRVIFIQHSDSGTVIPELRYSADNITWSDWQPFKNTQTLTNFRYLQYRVSLSTTDTSNPPYVTVIYVIVDMPDVETQGRIAISIGGTVIPYGFAYARSPTVVCTADGADKYAVISGMPGLESVTVKVLSLADNSDVGGNINWRAIGY